MAMHGARESTMAENVVMLMSRLNSFRPSDRDALNKHFRDESTRDDAFRAVKNFVVRWEEADWLEAYSVERIGKWVSKYQGEEVFEELVRWCREKQTAARDAFASGLKKGEREREQDYA